MEKYFQVNWGPDIVFRIYFQFITSSLNVNFKLLTKTKRPNFQILQKQQFGTFILTR